MEEVRIINFTREFNMSTESLPDFVQKEEHYTLWARSVEKVETVFADAQYKGYLWVVGYPQQEAKKNPKLCLFQYNPKNTKNTKDPWRSVASVNQSTGVESKRSRIEHHCGTEGYILDRKDGYMLGSAPSRGRP